VLLTSIDCEPATAKRAAHDPLTAISELINQSVELREDRSERESRIAIVAINSD
jgi:hypothetical protein